MRVHHIPSKARAQYVSYVSDSPILIRESFVGTRCIASALNELSEILTIAIYKAPQA